MNTIELWKDITGYEDCYQISNCGNVRSKKRNKLRIVKTNRCGYKQLNLCKNGIIKTLLVHRLVALEFIENIFNKPCINHIDGNKTNNNYNNLEWVTVSENVKHAFDNNLQIPLINESHPMVKLSDNAINTIRCMYNTGNYSQTYIAEKFNCSQ